MKAFLVSLTAALVMTPLAGVAIAQTQQDFLYLQDRVQRLEAQIYGAGGNRAPTGGAPGASDQTIAQLSLRIDNLEQQIRTLTGKAEEAAFKAQRLEEQLQRFQGDVEFRFRELQGGGISAIPDPIPVNPGAPGQPASGPTPQGLTQNGFQPSVPAAQPAPAITPGRPLDLRALASNPQAFQAQPSTSPQPVAPQVPADQLLGQVPAQPLPNGQLPNLSGIPLGLPADGSSSVLNDQTAALSQPDPFVQYERAYAQYVAQNYGGARDALSRFIVDFPQHALARDAQYLIGESHFAQGDFRNAADAFLQTYTKYEGDNKKPESLLGLGLSLSKLGQKDAACSSLSELTSKYAGEKPDLAARGRTEASSLGC